jgi:hypothetical protein
VCCRCVCMLLIHSPHLTTHYTTTRRTINLDTPTTKHSSAKLHHCAHKYYPTPQHSHTNTHTHTHAHSHIHLYIHTHTPSQHANDLPIIKYSAVQSARFKFPRADAEANLRPSDLALFGGKYSGFAAEQLRQQLMGSGGYALITIRAALLNLMRLV